MTADPNSVALSIISSNGLYDTARRDADPDTTRQRRERPALHGAAINYFSTVDVSNVRQYWNTDVVHTGNRCWQPVVIRLSCAQYVTENGQPVMLKSKRAALEWLKQARG